MKSFKYRMVKAPSPLCCHAIRILAGWPGPTLPWKTEDYIIYHFLGILTCSRGKT